MEIQLFDGLYDDEGLHDLNRDITEHLEHPDIEKDENGFAKGYFRVTIVYREED